MSQRKLPSGLHRETLAVRAGVGASQYGENSEALYLTSSFTQPDSETAARRFAGEEEGYIYSRFTNPTVASMEQRLAALEGMEAAIGTSSGMSAILLLCMGLLKAGDHVVCSQSVFGSTIKLIAGEFGKFGVRSTFVSQTDVAQWRAAIVPETRLLFAETPTNPLTDVCDIQALADVAPQRGSAAGRRQLSLHAGAAAARAVRCRHRDPLGTKYLDGQGRVVAGALVGPRQLIADKFIPSCAAPACACRPSMPGWCSRAWRRWASAWKRSRSGPWSWRSGCNRIRASSASIYPGLESHPQHALAMAQQSGRGGAVVSFDVRAADPGAARRNAFNVVDSTQLLSVTANLGDVKTIITHPPAPRTAA